MAKVLVVTSGKGGVGKTTSTAALGAALAQSGEKGVVVDFDVGLRNLDLVMGAERRVVYDLINVAQGDAKLPQALIRDKRVDTLSLLAASQTRDKEALTGEGVARVMGELRQMFDWVICDSPAGIERGAQLAMRHADVAVVVTNPEVSEVDPMRGTTAGGFVIGFGTVSDLSQNQATRACCCGPVGNASALSKRSVRSTALGRGRRPCRHARPPSEPARPAPDAAAGRCRRRPRPQSRPA